PGARRDDRRDRPEAGRAGQRAPDHRQGARRRTALRGVDRCLRGTDLRDVRRGPGPLRAPRLHRAHRCPLRSGVGLAGLQDDRRGAGLHLRQPGDRLALRGAHRAQARRARAGAARRARPAAGRPGAGAPGPGARPRRLRAGAARAAGATAGLTAPVVPASLGAVSTESSPEALDETAFDAVLCVVAHPDDIEYGMAAAVAKWTAAGKRVHYYLLTRGEAGIDTMEPVDAAPARADEERASAAVVGVERVEFGDHPDGTIEYGVVLRRDIAAAIRRNRPDLVVTLTHEETFVGGNLNQADHRAVGLATLDATADAGNR